MRIILPPGGSVVTLLVVVLDQPYFGLGIQLKNGGNRKQGKPLCARRKKLISLDRERGVITHIAALLGWDQETYMPESGIDERAEQLAIVENLAHEKAVNPGIGELLNRLEGEKDLSGQEKAYRRVSRREYDKETKLPAGLVSEMARQTSLSRCLGTAGKTTFQALRSLTWPR